MEVHRRGGDLLEFFFPCYDSPLPKLTVACFDQYPVIVLSMLFHHAIFCLNSSLQTDLYLYFLKYNMLCSEMYLWSNKTFFIVIVVCGYLVQCRGT